MDGVDDAEQFRGVNKAFGTIGIEPNKQMQARKKSCMEERNGCLSALRTPAYQGVRDRVVNRDCLPLHHTQEKGRRSASLLYVWCRILV